MTRRWATIRNVLAPLSVVAITIAVIADIEEFRQALDELQMKDYWYWLLGASVVLAVGIGLIVRRWRDPHKTLQEQKGVAVDWTPCVRLARTAEEVGIIGRMDEKQYDSKSVDAKKLVDWWRVYPNGVYLFVKGSIVGALGIWPLKDEVFSKLVDGQLEEAWIESEDICVPNGRPFARWYLADILVDPDSDVKKGQGILLAEIALERWLSSDHLPTDDPIHICALGFTANGRNAMSNFGMNQTHCTSPQSGYQVFYVSRTVAELKAMLRGRQETRLLAESRTQRHWPREVTSGRRVRAKSSP